MAKEQYFKITEVVEYFSIKKTLIIQSIEQKWIDPADPETQKLDREDIARINLIQELQDDMGVNDEAVPIILHLVDQINYLRLKMETQKANVKIKNDFKP